MATWNAFYIGTGNAGHEALARASEQLRDLRQTFRGTLTLRQAPNASWIEVECSGSNEHEDLMRRLSKQMGSDVVGCLIQTTASVMSLYRFRNGEESRCLQYADGGGRRRAARPSGGRQRPSSPKPGSRKRSSPQTAMRRPRSFASSSWNAGFQTGRFEPHPDPWDCLLGSLAIGQGDWDSLRTTDGADVVRGAQGTKVGWLAMALVVGGFGLCSVSAAMRLPELGAGGFVASWVGLTIQLRRSSMVVAVGGGLLGACVLLLLGAAAGGVFHSLIR